MVTTIPWNAWERAAGMLSGGEHPAIFGSLPVMCIRQSSFSFKAIYFSVLKDSDHSPLSRSYICEWGEISLICWPFMRSSLTLHVGLHSPQWASPASCSVIVIIFSIFGGSYCPKHTELPYSSCSGSLSRLGRNAFGILPSNQMTYFTT